MTTTDKALVEAHKWMGALPREKFDMLLLLIKEQTARVEKETLERAAKAAENTGRPPNITGTSIDAARSHPRTAAQIWRWEMSEELKPVAFLYEDDFGRRYTTTERHPYRISEQKGWTETPLYSADQITAMQAKIAELEDSLHEARTGPWPEWADRIHEMLSAYGYLPTDGEVDLPSDLAAWLEEFVPADQDEITRLRAENERIEADRAAPSFDRCVERVFQAACNEFVNAVRQKKVEISKDNVFFLASRAIQDAWPDIIEDYTRDDPKHGAGDA